MSVPPPRLPAAEIAHRGDRIYEERVRQQVEAGNLGKVVAIDVNTGAYAVGETALAAAKDLHARQPSAEVWLVRIGQRALHRIGPRPGRNKP